MRTLVLGLAVAVGLAALPQHGLAQASEIPSAAPTSKPGESPEQRGRRLLDQMVEALGGPAWLNRGTMYREGSTARFFHNQPTGTVTQFIEYTRLANGSSPESTRIEFLTVRGMIMPGMKKDVAHLWTADAGIEVTFKGQSPLPAKQVEDYMRRRTHSIEEVMRTWVKAPDVMIVAEGTGTRDRRIVDKVTVLSANNDAVTLDLDASTHLPLQRSFEWRNEQFKDHDIDEESYSDYHLIDGVQTPLNVTRYRNGDMEDQLFYTRVRYGTPMGPELFDPSRLLVKK